MNDTTDLTSTLSKITDEYMQERLGQVKSYTLLLLRRTPKLAEPGSREIVWEHGRRNFALREQGTLPIVCPIDDDGEWAGMGIFDAPPEEVSRIIDGDPGVQAGLFTYEIHPVRGFPGSSLP
jgi:hypothetical protein